MIRYLATATLSLSLQCAPVFAGPVANFEGAFGDVYAIYRSALFATNSGDAEKSLKAMNGLDAKWSGLVAGYYLTPPPQYQDDPLWAETVDKVGGYVEKAKAEVENGQLPVAHETLEAVRDEIGNLHARNNIETFSDRMNAYHAEMEHVLELDLSTIDAATQQKLLEHAAVLSYLADDVLQSPPAKISDQAEYDALANAFESSVKKYLAAARTGDAEALKAAVGGLKVPYSKFFLKFG